MLFRTSKTLEAVVPPSINLTELLKLIGGIEIDTSIVTNIVNTNLLNYQLNTDNALTTTNKTIVGAINEIKATIPVVNLTGYQLKTDNTLNTTSKLIVGAINELKTAIPDITGLQTKTDNTLTTTSKTIVGAINEIKTRPLTASDGLLHWDGTSFNPYTANTNANLILSTDQNVSAYNGQGYLNLNGQFIVGSTNSLNDRSAITAFSYGGAAIQANSITASAGSFNSQFNLGIYATSGNSISGVFDNANANTSSILEARRNGVAKFIVDKDGNINIPSGQTYNIGGVPLNFGLNAIINTFTSGEAIPIQSLVMLNNGYAYKYDNTVNTSYPLGIASTTGTQFGSVTIYKQGKISITGWGLTPNTLYYAGASGALTATKPTTDSYIVVGMAIDANTLDISIQKGYSRYFLGKYNSLLELQTAYSTGFDGAEAEVINVSGVYIYKWNSLSLVWELPITSVGSSAVYQLPTSSTLTLGGVKVDGTTITINQFGVISSTVGLSYPIIAENQTTSIKLSNNTSHGGGSQGLIDLYINNTSAFTVTQLPGSGNACYVINTSSNASYFVNNNSTGTGYIVLNSGTGMGVDVSNGSGIGVHITNLTGQGLYIGNNGTGIGQKIRNNSTGIPFQITNSSDTEVFRIDASGNAYSNGVKLVGGGSSYELPIATSSILGGVMVDNSTIKVSETGILSIVGNYFVALGQTSRNWFCMCAAPNGNVYACDANGDIYMQTNGIGNFVALGQASRSWYGMCAAPNGNVYATDVNGDIYMQTNGTGNFVALGQASRNWRGLCATPNGNVYACVVNGDIYMQTNGIGNFVALGLTSRSWYGMCAAPNGNIYACDYEGDIYMHTNTIYTLPKASTTTLGGVKVDGTTITINESGVISSTGGSSMVYPASGVPNSTGTAWGTSYIVGTGANNLVQLNSSSQLPAVSAALLTNFPTLNQSTTGSAATLTTARTLAGNSFNGSANVPFTNKFIVQGTTDAGLTGAQFLGSLGTGIVKNTTSTGVLSIATGADLPTMTATVGGAVPTPPNNTTTFLRGDGTFATPIGSGDMVLANIQTITGAKTFNDGKFLLNNVAGTFTSSFTNTNTTSRVYTLKDASGTIAFVSDITGTNSGTNTGDNAVNSLYSGLVTNATHTGDATGSTALTVVRINGTLLSGLGTGLLKNTTGTGVPSIAVGSDIPNIAESQVTNLVTDLGLKAPLASPTFTGTLNIGTLGYTPANAFTTFQNSVNSYDQLIISNTNTGTTASSDFIVNNFNSTDGTYYGDFGINGSGFTGTGAFNQPNYVYLTATSVDLAIGTTTSNAIHFVVNNGATDAMTIATTGVVTIPALTATTPVINGLVTGTGVATAATVSTIALRDANGNLNAVNHLEGYATTVTAAGTTTLTVASAYMQYFTGSSTQTIQLPVTSTLILGQQYCIVNRSSSGNLTVNSSGANLVSTILPGQTGVFTCILTSGTTAASWDAQAQETSLGVPAANAYMLVSTTAGVRSWVAQPSGTIPTQTGNSGKYLTTDGTTASWGTIGQSYATTATAAGTTTLVVGSAINQLFTGSTTQTVVMPVTSTLTLGQTFNIINNSTGAITINSSGSNAIIILAGGTSAILTCILTSGTTAASWSYSYAGSSIATSKKLVVSNSITLAGTDATTITLPSTTGTVALNNQTCYIGTTAVAINRASAALTLAGITLTTPVLGAATATTINNITITQPATSATLTLVQGSSLITAGAYAITLTSTAATNVTLPTTGTLATLAGTETFTNKTLTSPKVAIGTPSASLDGNGTIISGTAGETLAFGDLVYIKSDGKFWKAKGDAVATTPVVGMALAAITSGASGNILITGIARYDSWTWTVGGAIYLSTATSGGMTQTEPATTGNQVQIIGFALSATNILFQPNPIIVQV